ncbi:MAG TPA: hypothetical protein VG734_06540 [Lacunisphaera sp.]|nr:hypothetical protein [Lacunisphaera sp.]
MIFADKKSARDKRLLRLERELNRLYRARWHAPIIPLEHPYQRGWVKTYRLRADALHHPDAKVFQAVFPVVNHRVISRRRDFLAKDGRVVGLGPRIIPVHEWARRPWPFTHQRLFAYGDWPWDMADSWGVRQGHIRGFRLMRTWWLEEFVGPLMITHQRVDLPDVRTRIAEIESHLRHTCGHERLRNLHGRRARFWLDPRSQPISMQRAELAADATS